MSDAVWPVSLPQAPLTPALRVSPPDLLVRSAMDVGPAKVRRRATVGPTLFTIEMLMSATQLATFETFWRDTVQYGALTFDFKNPQTGAAGAEMRFASKPEWLPRAPRTGSEMWRVSFTLELLPSADAIVIGGGDTNPPEGGAWFQPPPPPPDSRDGEPVTDTSWGAMGVVEDPPALPDGLLWQFGADGDAGGTGDPSSGDGTGGALTDGGDGSGGMQAPIAGQAGSQSNGEGSISVP